MSDSTCVVCDATSVEPGQACRECHASPDWQDLFRATLVAGEQCTDLHRRGLMSEAALRRAEEVLNAMRAQWAEQARQNLPVPGDTGLPPPLRCRQCDRTADAAQNFCATCGGPTGARADRLRHLDFTLHLITHSLVSDMPAEMAQQCVASIRIQLRAVEMLLKRPPTASPPDGVAAGVPARRNFLEILLDPQSIRWLLGIGGGLLAVGLVIFLSSLGVFKNAMVVASTMGVGTLATVVGGIALIRLTRHALAGRSVALLGCLVMPLNLWFYNANNLITLDGHLWAAAMVCCMLYAAAAFVLKDPLFVFVLFGGVTMTGMLALADLHRVAEISAPAALLVSLGLISLHAERVFADDDGPFSRRRFGLACFRSAQGLVGLGLLLLVGSQVAAWTVHFGLGLYGIAALPSNPLLTLGLVIAGGYSYAYSSLVVRRSAACEYAAVGCLLWAELLGIQLAHLTSHGAVLLSAMALTSLAINLAGWLQSRGEADGPKRIAASLAPLGLGLIALAVAMGLLPFLHTVFAGAIDLPHISLTWAYAGAMALVAASSRVAAGLHARVRERLSVAYHFAAATATFIGIASILSLVGLTPWAAQAPLLMAIPLIYLFAARLHSPGPARRALPMIAGAAATILSVTGLAIHGSHWIAPAVGQTLDVWLAVFALEAATFFAIAAARHRAPYAVYLAAAWVCAAIYQLLGFWGLPGQSFSVAIAVAGLFGLAALRFVDAAGHDTAGRNRALFSCSHALVSLPMTGVMLMTLSRLVGGHMDGAMLWTPATLGGLALLAALLSTGGARRWYIALAISQVALSGVALAQFSTLTLPRKLELFSTLSGLVLLVTGYGLWYRNQDGPSENVGGCLLFGALLAGLPPAIFAVVNRFGFDVSFVDELALMTIAVLMFLTGLMARVRATTLIGGGLLFCHLATLVVFAGMKAQLAVGAYVAIGGAALFAVGIVLSIYRDRLLTMPDRIKHRQGLFRVLAWT